MNKKIQGLIIILLLCTFTSNSIAQNAIFEAQLQTITNLQNKQDIKIGHKRQLKHQLIKNKKHSIGLRVRESAFFKTQYQTGVSNYTKSNCQQQIFSRQSIHFDNVFQTKFNASSQPFNPIIKVSGETGAQDPPEAPLNSEIQLLILLLTVYLSIKK